MIYKITYSYYVGYYKELLKDYTEIEAEDIEEAMSVFWKLLDCETSIYVEDILSIDN